MRQPKTIKHYAIVHMLLNKLSLSTFRPIVSRKVGPRSSEDRGFRSDGRSEPKALRLVEINLLVQISSNKLRLNTFWLIVPPMVDY